MKHLATLNDVRVATTAAGGLEAAVGNTPLLPLRRVGAHLPPGVQVFAKAEWFNPGGSVKDRPALNILRTALATARWRAASACWIRPPATWASPTPPLGRRWACRSRWPLPANASPERIAILRALGAELVLTDPLEGSDGALRVARQMAAEQPERYFYANQYDNPANWQAHYLLHRPGDRPADRRAGHPFRRRAGHLRHADRRWALPAPVQPAIQLIAVQPDSPFHGLEGLKHMPTAIQPGIFDAGLPDRTVEVPTEAAYAMVRRLAREEGLFVGISSGAAALAALQVAARARAGRGGDRLSGRRLQVSER